MAYLMRLVRDEYQKVDLPPNSFVESFDPLAFDGRGYLRTTTNPEQAKHYVSREEALAEWHGTSLRAYTALIEPVKAR